MAKLKLLNTRASKLCKYLILNWNVFREFFRWTIFDGNILVSILINTRVSAAFGRQNPRLDGREITSPEDYQSGR